VAVENGMKSETTTSAAVKEKIDFFTAIPSLWY
jgi:hypothetical protein